MSQAGSTGSGGGGTPTVITLDGDVSFATGSTISIITGVSTINSGATFEFVGNGTTTIELNVTDSDQNTIIGNLAGNLTLTGTGNTGFGSHSLSSLSTGDQNAALGINSLASLTSGNSNVGIGGNSLGSIQEDFGNTAIGFNSLALLNGGNQNTSIGTSAGASITTGSFNIFIGNSAGQTNTTSESSNIYLNSFGVVAESNSLRIGRATGTSFEQLNKAFISGINGVTLGGTPLVVTIDSATDQLGVAAFPSGSGIGTINGDIGSASGLIVTFTALDGADNSGSSVSFAASADKVVLNVTDVNQNTMIGHLAGSSSIDSSGNTALGQSALSGITTGGSNVAIGLAALTSLTSGIENCALGQGIAPNLISGNYNVYIGADSGVNNASNEESNIYINSLGEALESNTLRIGLGTGTGTKELSTAFVSGINGNTLSGTPLAVTIDATTNQLGVATFPVSSGITIDTDTGSVTGSTIILTALDGADNSGSSVFFAGSGSTVVLNLSDAFDNVILGKNAGNSFITGIQNMGMGALSLQHCNTGQNNVGIGWGSLFQLTSGQANVAIGTVAGVNIRNGAYNINIGMSSGNNLQTSESSDIYLNSQGVEGESNILRIGQATGTGNQELSTAFIHGINGNTLGGTPLMVTIDSSTSQLGTQAIPAGSFTWVDVTSSTQTIDANTGYVTDFATTVTYTLPATPLFGDIFKITSGATAAATSPWVIAQNASQQIHFGATSTTVGVTGSLAATLQYDSVELVCVVAGAASEWVVLNSTGNITIA